MLSALNFQAFSKMTYIVENSTDVLVPQARAAAILGYKWKTLMVRSDLVTEELVLRDFSHYRNRVSLRTC